MRNSNKTIFFISVAILVSTIILLTQNTSAQPEPNPTNSVDDVKLEVTFQFPEGDEIVNSFSVFDQLGGYDKLTLPIFSLEGITGQDKSMIYDWVDKEYHQQIGNKRFNVNVVLSDGNFKNSYLYEDCLIQNYYVTTLYDKNKTYQNMSEFAYVDHFEFECSGFHPLHHK